jgi:uracil phosphoribosyltransferase
MVHDLSRSPGMLGVYISELRDQERHGDSLRFRANLERVGMCLALEMAQHWVYEPRKIQTPLGQADGVSLADQPVLAAILRSGLPMHEGMLRVFDKADSAFVSAYRKHQKGGEFEISIDYLSTPPLEGRTLVVIDPLLATGSSATLVIKELLKHGTPDKIHIACAIASVDGVSYVRDHLPPGTEIWAAAVDEETTAKGYIVPGLGDPGDLAYGRKRS